MVLCFADLDKPDVEHHLSVEPQLRRSITTTYLRYPRCLPSQASAQTRDIT